MASLFRLSGDILSHPERINRGELQFLSERVHGRVRAGIFSRIIVLGFLRLPGTGTVYVEIDDGSRMSKHTSRVCFKGLTAEMIEPSGTYYLNHMLRYSELGSSLDDHVDAG